MHFQNSAKFDFTKKCAILYTKTIMYFLHAIPTIFALKKIERVTKKLKTLENLRYRSPARRLGKPNGK